MTLFTLFILALGLSMDAFAVSICKGLAMKKLTLKNASLVGIWFGGFQALMPTIGYFLGSQFKNLFTSFDHWISFGLLVLIGGNMLHEAWKNDEEITDDSLNIKTMLILAIATSIDAFAIGISFAFLEDVNLALAVTLIGVTTFLLSMLGVKIGNIFGTKYKAKAEFSGGIILIILGVKILFEHLLN